MAQSRSAESSGRKLLEWQLTDADEAGVAYLGLPVSGSDARAILRGKFPASIARARVTRPGRFTDMHSLGWPGLYALSSSMVAEVVRFAGTVLRPLNIDSGSGGYSILGVTGRCGSVDYSQSQQLERSDGFVRLRGLHVSEPEAPVDFAVPTNRESILVTSAVVAALKAPRFRNVRFRPLASIEFDIPEELLSGESRGC